MKILNYSKRMWSGLFRAFQDHPLAMACGLAGAISGIGLIEFKSSEDLFTRILLVLWIGIPLSIAFDLIAQSGLRFSSSTRILLRALPLVILGLAWLGIAHLNGNLLAIRFALWAVAAHCLVAVSPFLGNLVSDKGRDFNSEDLRGFNLLLFERVILAVIFSHVLFAGIALAIAACDPLLNLKVPERTYLNLWFLIVGVFQTAYLVIGIPKKNSEWRNRPLHPALKFLPKYILLPLGLLYLIILYAYGVKALALWEWPRGWASSLILIYSGVMLLTLLIMDKGENAEGQKVHQRLTRGLFGALGPLLILLFLAIGKRISDYGVTEDRYLVVALAIWLTLITLIHLIKGRTLVIGIPLSLGLFAITISIGSWNVFEISDLSQGKKLKSLLIQTERFKDGRLRNSKIPVDKSMAGRISEHIRWFEKRKRTAIFQSWLSSPSDTCSDCIALWKDWPGSKSFLLSLGIEYQEYGRYGVGVDQILYRGIPSSRLLNLYGYEKALTLGEKWQMRENGNTLDLGLDSLKLEYSSDQFKIKKGLMDNALLDLTPLALRVKKLSLSGVDDQKMPIDSLFAEMEYSGKRWLFSFGSISLDTVSKPPKVKDYSNAILLIGESHP